ncbi:MAG: PAS domain S-box protein [Pedobacter sp.]|jgi:PAS domain S-box-containing protein|uniref:PAS domain S-box protein n=1 Tax=Pedobacter sp. TaxID=1411316 RepID=UPI00356598B7
MQNIKVRVKIIPQVWDTYQQFVESAILSPSYSKTSESEHISDTVFLHAITYGIPLGLVVILFGLVLNARIGISPMAMYGLFFYLFTVSISLIRQINLPLRKFLSSTPLVIIGTLSFLYQGITSSGFIYLLLFSVFYALQVNGRYAYFSIYLNMMVCLFIACIIKFHINSGVGNALNLKIWLKQTINFLFLNIVTVVMIRQTIKSLNRIIQSKIVMEENLKQEILQKTALHSSLDATEDRYKKLFHMSPCAQLIFDTESKRFIKINQAACAIYGYSEYEFLKLKLSDILIPEDHQDLIKKMADESSADLKTPLYYKHIGKGTIMLDAEILWGDIDLRGSRATLLIVNDVTLQVAQFGAISRQNTLLKKIVHIQSHSIRQPLTKIMSLTELIADEHATETNQLLFDYLSKSAKELDLLIHEVIKESELILKDLDTSVPPIG